MAAGTFVDEAQDAVPGDRLFEGRIAAVGSPLEITATGAGLTKISVRTQAASLQSADGDLPAVTRSLSKDDYRIYFSADIGLTLAAIIARVTDRGDALIDLRVERPSLEDRFLEITGAGGPS